MTEETEEPVQIHVGRTFHKALLQRVLEVVDSFVRILQKVILEDCLIHVCISSESAYLNQLADFSVVRWRLLGGH